MNYKITSIFKNPHQYTVVVSPLLLATEAGAAGQRAIGTVVFGGMLASTLLAIPFVPVFYVVTERLAERMGKKKTPPST